MMTPIGLLATLSLLAWLWLLLCHGRFWRSGPVLPAAPSGAVDPAPPAVAVVVPARDEAEFVEASLRSLLGQDYAGPFRVVLVDDRSTDGTGRIARALDGAGARLMVLDGAPRPPGWSGKLWALEQGIRATNEALVLLADADIVHDPGHLAALVAQLRQGGLGGGPGGELNLVSEMVRLRCESLAERALVPAFVYFFQMLYPFARVNDPAHLNTAAAAGGTVLIRRAALARIGGLEAMRGALIDDVTLARRVKLVGRIWLGHATGARSLRAYPGPGDIWRMVARTAYVQLNRSPWMLAGALAGLSLVWLVPVWAALAGATRAGGGAPIMGLLAWIIAAATYLPTLRRFGRSPLWAPLLPLVALFYMAATCGSAIDHHWGRGVAWKGRAYAGPEA